MMLEDADINSVNTNQKKKKKIYSVKYVDLPSFSLLLRYSSLALEIP